MAAGNRRGPQEVAHHNRARQRSVRGKLEPAKLDAPLFSYCGCYKGTKAEMVNTNQALPTPFVPVHAGILATGIQCFCNIFRNVLLIYDCRWSKKKKDIIGVFLMFLTKYLLKVYVKLILWKVNNAGKMDAFLLYPQQQKKKKCIRMEMNAQAKMW